MIRNLARRARRALRAALRELAPPGPASSAPASLAIRYTHRASVDGRVDYRFLSHGRDLTYRLYAMEFSQRDPVRGQAIMRLSIPSVNADDELAVNILAHEAWLNGNELRSHSLQPSSTRKYIAELEINDAGRRLSRLCSHYLPYEGKVIGEDYYFGDDYTDYYLHTAEDQAVELVSAYVSSGRLLDVGCALGVYSSAFQKAGFDTYGIDISGFAVDEACRRLGEGRARACDLDSQEIPFDATFEIIWMWDVLEHTADPRSALEKVTRTAAPGSRLFLRTSNASSLTHRLLGADWEGYTDYSHKGVEKVSAASLRLWLSELGWSVHRWECEGVWVFGADPVLTRLKAVFLEYPELRTFLAERELGDALSVVAVNGK